MCTTKMNKTSLAHKWLMATPKKTKTLYQLETRQSQARRSGKWSKISQWTKTTTASPAIPKTHSLLMSQEYLAKTQTYNNLKSYLIRWIYWFQIMKQRQLRIWQKGVKHYSSTAENWSQPTKFLTQKIDFALLRFLVSRNKEANSLTTWSAP